MEVDQRKGDAHLERLRRYAWWLDSGIPVPGTHFRIGLDPIIGLIPGVGDAAGAILATWILVEGVRRGLPRATLLRMALNIGIDALVGAVPVVGDLFDFAWKANVMNVTMLERYQRDPGREARKDRLFVVMVSLAGVLFCLVIGLGGFLLALKLLKMAFSGLR